MIIDIAKENIFVTSISTGIQYQVLAFKLRNNKVIEYLIDNKYADMWNSGIQWWKASHFYNIVKIPSCVDCCCNRRCKKCGVR